MVRKVALARPRLSGTASISSSGAMPLDSMGWRSLRQRLRVEGYLSADSGASRLTGVMGAEPGLPGEPPSSTGDPVANVAVMRTRTPIERRQDRGRRC